VITRPKDSARLTLLDKVNVCLQDFGDHVMHLVFDVTKPVDITRMQKAARLSLTQHPIMAQRLCYRWGQPYWSNRHACELDQYRYCELIISSHRQQAIDAFLIQETDYNLEPMVKIRVIRGQYDTICIKVSCTPIDGRGFLIYVEDVLRIYERLKQQPEYQPPAGTLDNRSTKALLPYFNIVDALKLLFYGLKNQATDSLTARNWRVPSLNASHIDKTYYCHQFSPSTLRAINGYRKKHNLTFNDIVLGAYYKALYNAIKPPKAKLFCVLNTFDLRRFEPSNAPNRVANYSSFVNTNVFMDNNTDFAQAAQGVNQSIKQRKAHYPGMTEGPFIWPILTFLPFPIASFIVKQLLKHRGETIPVFTNVGVINTENMRVEGFPISNVRPFAPLEFPPKLTVTVATSGNVVSLSVGFSKNHFPESLIHQLFQQMEDQIRDTCLQPSKEVGCTPC
jgi:NRPS condensation-like uncharacterized protein